MKKFYLFRYKACPTGTQSRLLVYAADLEQAVVKANERMFRDYGESGSSMILRVGHNYLLKVFDNAKSADLGIGPGCSLLSSLCRQDLIEFLQDRNEELGQGNLTSEERQKEARKKEGRQDLFGEQCNAKFSALRLELREDARREGRLSEGRPSEGRPLQIDKDAHSRDNLAGISRPETTVVA